MKDVIHVFRNRLWTLVSVGFALVTVLGPTTASASEPCDSNYTYCSEDCSDAADHCVAGPGSYGICQRNFNQCMNGCEQEYYSCENPDPDPCDSCGIWGTICPPECGWPENNADSSNAKS
jgi:hypothetical protein